MLLEGILVVESGSGIATAYCGRVLRSLGATVIKVESRETPDWVRSYGAACATHPRASSTWCHLNGAKVRVVLHASDAGTLTALLAPADLVIAGPDLLGERAAAACPASAALVQIVPAVDGPAGFAVHADESAGVAAGLRDPFAGNVPPGGLRMDIAQVNAGAHAAATATLALTARELGNSEPVRVQVGIYEAALSMIEIAAQNLLLQGKFGGGLPDMMTATAAPPPYVCSDGGMVAINLWGKDVWTRMCEVMERPDMASDARFTDTASRYAHPGEIREILMTWCASVTRDVAVARMRAGLIPSAPVLGFDETLRDEQLLARGLVGTDVGHPRAMGSCYVIDGARDALPYLDPATAIDLLQGPPSLRFSVSEADDAVVVELR